MIGKGQRSSRGSEIKKESLLRTVVCSLGQPGFLIHSNTKLVVAVSVGIITVRIQYVSPSNPVAYRILVTLRKFYLMEIFYK